MKLLNWGWFKDNAYIYMVILITIMTIIYISKHIDYKSQIQTNEKRIASLSEANKELALKVVEFENEKRNELETIKNYILKYFKTIPPTIAQDIAKNVILAANKYKLPVATIVAVMEIESQFNPTLCSSKGARGLMQVMSIWVKELGLNSRFDFHDITTGIDSGAYVLKKYLTNEKNDGNMEKALYQYVNYDKQYVRDVYNAMGKFIVFKGLPDKKDNLKEVIQKEEDILLELDNKEQETVVEEEAIKTLQSFTHTVKYHGETLSLIAKWYTGSVMNWKKIQELNPNIIPEQMQIGATIILPIELLKTRVLLMKEYVQTN